MKKSLFLITLQLFTYFSFAQTTSETNLDGTKPIFRTNSFGTASGFFPKNSILGRSGNTSSTSFFGFAQNSTVKNYSIYGYANRAILLGNVFNAKGVIWNIQTNSGSNISVAFYGIYATTTATGTGSESAVFFNTNGTSNC